MAPRPSRRRLAAAGLALPLVAAAAALLWWALSRPEPGLIRYDPDVPLAPDRVYALRLWDYRWPTAPDGEPYEAWLRTALAGFSRLHPNVRVEYRLLDPATGAAELAAAVRAGDPPDVYGTLPGQPVFYDRTLQVPADLFLTPAERGGRKAPPAYLVAAVRGASHAGRQWAWPRLLAAHLWLGHRRALASAAVNPAAVAREGWDWHGFAAALAGARGQEIGLLVNPVSPEAFQDLLRAWAGPAGPALWTRQGVREVASWLAQLRHNELLTAPAPEEAADAMVARLLEGQAMVLAGASPWLGAKLIHLAGGGPSGPDLVLLPVPGPAGNPPALRVETSCLVVFRQRAYQGHDHTRAAVELARYLSALRHPWALPGTPLLPASRPRWEAWRTQGGFPPLLAPLLDDPAQPEGLDVRQAEARDRRLADAVSSLAAFWSGQVSPAELAARLGTEQPSAARPSPWWRRLRPPW